MKISTIFFKIISLTLFIVGPYFINFLKVIFFKIKFYSTYRKWINFEIALILTILGTLFPPKGDILDYYNDFEELKNLDFSYFLLFLKTKSDYLLYILEYIFGKLNLSFKALQFSILLFANIIWMKLLTEIQTKERNNQYFFLCIFLMFNLPIYFMYRSMMASLLLSFGIYLFLNKKKYIYFLISSILWHKSMVLILFIFIIGYCFRKYSQVKMFLSTLILGVLMYKVGLVLMQEFFPRFYQYYVLGYWGTEFLKEMSINEKIALFFPVLRYLAILFLYIIYLTRIKLKDKMFNLGIAIVLISLMYFFSIIGFIRLLYSFTLMVLVINISEIKEVDFKYNLLVKLIVITIFILCYIVQILDFKQFLLNINYLSIFNESILNIFIN